MAPPQLTRDAPVVHVVHPGEPAWLEAGWVNHGVAVANRITRGLGQRLDLDPPLHRQPRFNDFTAALRVPDAVQVGALFVDDAALLGKRLTNLDPCLEAVQAVEFGSGVDDPGLGVQHRRHRQLMTQADLEVVRVVGGSGLDCARSEFGVDVVVGDDHDFPVDERVVQRMTDQVPVAFVVGMHRDRRVAEHRLHPGGGHHDVGFVVAQRAVPERHQLALDVFVLDLEVRNRGLQHRRPVHQSFGLVDQPGVEEPLEDSADGARQAVVHGGPVATPVHSVAQPAHLCGDGAARVVLPVPNLVDEQLAAEVLFGLAVDRRAAFRRRSGWRCRRCPCRAATVLRSLACACAGERVHQGVVERSAHAQAAGHVWRRQHDRERGVAAGRVAREVPAFYQPSYSCASTAPGPQDWAGRPPAGGIRTSAGGHRAIDGPR